MVKLLRQLYRFVLPARIKPRREHRNKKQDETHGFILL
jgi:hypothetical protein